MESQTGNVTIDGRQMAATLSMIEGQLNLQVTNSESPLGHPSRTKIDLLSFRGSRNRFALLNLRQIGSHARLGVGEIASYDVDLALEDVAYDSLDDITGKTWRLHLEDFSKIFHVTGLQHDIIFDESGGLELRWFFKPAAQITLECPKARLKLLFGQSMKTGGDFFTGPNLNFRYPVTIVFEAEQQLNPALVVLYQIRSFFSLLMGRVLAIDELSLCLEDDMIRHDAKVHGLPSIRRNDKPNEPIVKFESQRALASMLDEWLVRYDQIEEAIGLHINGLEQRDFPWQIRFQIFVQALEALHRRTNSFESAAIDVDAVSAALAKENIPGEVIERVGGMLAHSHEPSLSHRLKCYWDQFSSEIEALRPSTKKQRFVERVVATRNHLAHRTDENSKVLKDGDLWDHTETIKAISHMALLSEIGCDVTGLGEVMLLKRFTQYVLVPDVATE